MSTHNPQVVEPEEFIEVLDYEFSGNSVTLENKRRFIEALRYKASVYHAAQAAGIARKTAYKYMHDDPAFAEAVADCREDVADVMETSVYEDALGRDGKRGDTLLKMFWLKAHRPKFRDKLNIDVQVVQNEIDVMLQAHNERQQLLLNGSIPTITAPIQANSSSPSQCKKDDGSDSE